MFPVEFSFKPQTEPRTTWRIGAPLPLFETKFNHRYTCGAGSNGGDGNIVAWFSHFSVKMIWVRLGFKKVAYWDLSRYPKCSGLTFFWWDNEDQPLYCEVQISSYRRSFAVEKASILIYHYLPYLYLYIYIYLIVIDMYIYNILLPGVNL